MSEILIRQSDGTWREATHAGYALESDLQSILAAHPHLIPGVGTGAKTCREFQSEVGPADVVVVGSEGEVTLVECKLATNPQVRREIVGQMFDYASRLWNMDVDDFAERWYNRTQQSLFGEGIVEGVPSREALARTLAEGRFRIVLAVDAINPALKRIVEYLNFMSGPSTSVIAVEYSRLMQDNIEILMPRIFGQELAEAKSGALKVGAGGYVLWDTDTYRSWLESNDSSSLRNFDLFIEEASHAQLPFIGSKARMPSGHLEILDSNHRRLGTVSIYYYSSRGASLEFDFTRLSKLSPADMPKTSLLNAFVDQLGQTVGMSEVADNLRSTAFASRRPNVPLSLVPEESIRQVFVALRVLTS